MIFGPHCFRWRVSCLRVQEIILIPRKVALPGCPTSRRICDGNSSVDRAWLVQDAVQMA